MEQLVAPMTVTGIKINFVAFNGLVDVSQERLTK